jgi:hypothetical protein
MLRSTFPDDARKNGRNGRGACRDPWKAGEPKTEIETRSCAVMVHAVDEMDAMDANDVTVLVNSSKRLSDGRGDPQGGAR